MRAWRPSWKVSGGQAVDASCASQAALGVPGETTAHQRRPRRSHEEPGAEPSSLPYTEELAPGTDDKAAERVGSVLNDKWTLERLIGVGGMAAVYAGRHRNGARAAVKLLHPDLARHKEVRERFQREGYAANKVDHPGVVKVLDDDVVSGGADAGTAYLVMELLEGESVQDRLERRAGFGEREFLELASEVLAVLEAAHERGVVHRDLKPENLFFAREEGSTKTRVKVLDFGLARLLDAQSVTTYGLALGTPSFMSPEQAGGRSDEIDGRTNLFALAATGFQVRTGRKIHEAQSTLEVVAMMSRLPAPRIATITPGVSAPFARIIDRALEFNREDRYESASAMRDDVKRALSELDATPPAFLPPAAPPLPAKAVPAAPPLPAKAVRPSKKARSRVSATNPTIDVSASDLEPRPVYGMDESIRIPKRRSIVPWLALLLAGGGAFAFLRDDAHRASVLETLDAWRTSLVGPAASSASSPSASSTIGLPGSAAPNASARSTGDAGATHPTGSVHATPTSPMPSGSATHHPTPPKLPVSSAQKVPRPPGAEP